MALTPTEEALVRDLLAQQAAILSLANNEATITSKLGATKVNLSDLTSASGVSDTDYMLIRQSTTDKNITPLTLKGYYQTGLATQKGVQAADYNTSVAGGTANAITGDYDPNILALENGLTLYVRAASANTITTPTFSPDGLTAKTIVKGSNSALQLGDIAGAGHWLELQYDLSLDKWVLQNPSISISERVQPSFSVHRNNVNQTGIVSGVNTKILFTTEKFDTNNNFDLVLSRFTPTIAGKYLISVSFRLNSATDQSSSNVVIYKNGGSENRGVSTQSGAVATQSSACTAIIDLNGTTDYVEFYAIQDTGTNRDIVGDQIQTYAMGMRLGV